MAMFTVAGPYFVSCDGMLKTSLTARSIFRIWVESCGSTNLPVHLGPVWSEILCG